MSGFCTPRNLDVVTQTPREIHRKPSSLSGSSLSEWFPLTSGSCKMERRCYSSDHFYGVSGPRKDSCISDRHISGRHQISLPDKKQAEVRGNPPPDGSSVMAKVMLVQSRCAMVNSGFRYGVLPAGVEQSKDAQADRQIEVADQSQKLTIMQRFWGCLRPLVNFCNKRTAAITAKSEYPWEVPFESISDLKWLGSGAQGVVFRGCLRGETVAVKKVNSRSDTNIVHLRRLKHPNIVQFKGVCVEERCYCIIMEYCPCGQLYEAIHGKKSIPPATIQDWAEQIARGMRYLHSQKIMHCDLKSPNVLIGLNHVLKISDFGAAREWTETSARISFTGTAAWMAPEIIRNERCSLKVDVWSYGVMLWELLTEEIPYNNVDSTAIIWGVANDTLHLPLPSSCPLEYRVLMKMCWNPKPCNRPNFQQILSHLELASTTFLQYNEQKFLSDQQLMKEQIALHFQGIQIDGQGKDKPELLLLRRRREELSHAQDIRLHYDDKLERVNELCTQLEKLLAEVEEQRRQADAERRRYEQLSRQIQEPLHFRMGSKRFGYEEAIPLGLADRVQSKVHNLLSTQSPVKTRSHYKCGEMEDCYFDRWEKNPETSNALTTNHPRLFYVNDSNYDRREKIHCPLCGAIYSPQSAIGGYARSPPSSVTQTSTGWNPLRLLTQSLFGSVASTKDSKGRMFASTDDLMRTSQMPPPAYEAVVASALTGAYHGAESVTPCTPFLSTKLNALYARAATGLNCDSCYSNHPKIPQISTTLRSSCETLDLTKVSEKSSTMRTQSSGISSGCILGPSPSRTEDNFDCSSNLEGTNLTSLSPKSNESQQPDVQRLLSVEKGIRGPRIYSSPKWSASTPLISNTRPQTLVNINLKNAENSADCTLILDQAVCPRKHSQASDSPSSPTIHSPDQDDSGAYDVLQFSRDSLFCTTGNHKGTAVIPGLASRTTLSVSHQIQSSPKKELEETLFPAPVSFAVRRLRVGSADTNSRSETSGTSRGTVIRRSVQTTDDPSKQALNGVELKVMDSVDGENGHDERREDEEVDVDDSCSFHSSELDSDSEDNRIPRTNDVYRGSFPLLGKVSPLWINKDTDVGELSTGNSSKTKRIQSAASRLSTAPKPQISTSVPVSTVTIERCHALSPNECECILSRPESSKYQAESDVQAAPTSRPRVTLRQQPGRRRQRPDLPPVIVHNSHMSSRSPGDSRIDASLDVSDSSAAEHRQRSSSFSASSSPSSTSADSHTHWSTEVLARELQAHMTDSLSDKEHHIRRVRSQLRRQQRQQKSIFLTVPYVCRSVDPSNTSTNSVNTRDPEQKNQSAHTPTGDSANVGQHSQHSSLPLSGQTRHRSLSQLAHLRHSLALGSSSIPLTSASLATTTGVISSITEADVDLSEVSDDFARELSDIRQNVNTGWNDEEVEEEVHQKLSFSFECSSPQPEMVHDIHEQVQDIKEQHHYEQEQEER
ncbi:unnamed protein product [Calicophoron daubneyi]|uniref:Protein kinase domain-containing protein n=1 Tax=Calicophoron daubneyi TaxID=300641 RepID=A0AAV2U213_CALDB